MSYVCHNNIKRLAQEGVTIKALSDELRNKLTLLETERSEAFSASKDCEDKVGNCVTKKDVDKACSLDNLKGDLSLKNILQDESGPLKQAVKGIIAQAQARDEGCSTREYIDSKWREQMKRATQDDVGLRDFALDDMGGMVCSTYIYIYTLSGFVRHMLVIVIVICILHL
jgi:phage-related protein